MWFFPKNQKTGRYEAKYLASMKSYYLFIYLYQTKLKILNKKIFSKLLLREDYAD